MPDPSPTIEQVADAYHRTKDVLGGLSKICIEVEGWPHAPGDQETDHLRHLRIALFQAVGHLNQALLPLAPFVDQLELGAFEGVRDVGGEFHETLALGTALQGDPGEIPIDTPLSADQARLVRWCVERLRSQGLAKLHLETKQALRRALTSSTTGQSANKKSKSKGKRGRPKDTTKDEVLLVEYERGERDQKWVGPSKLAEVRGRNRSTVSAGLNRVRKERPKDEGE